MKVFVELDQADGTAHIEWEGDTFYGAFLYLAERISKYEGPHGMNLDLSQPVELLFHVENQGTEPINLKALRVRTEATPVDGTQCTHMRLLKDANDFGPQCDEPASLSVKMYDHNRQLEYYLPRCSQHGEALRRLIADTGGYARSGRRRYQVLSVEQING